MTLFLGILIFSAIINSIAIVPFIDFLYRAKFNRRGTPLGGGVLIISTVTLLYALLFPVLSPMGVSITSFFSIKEELKRTRNNTMDGLPWYQRLFKSY